MKGDRASRRPWLAGVALAAALLAGTPAGAGWFDALFVPRAELWERWIASDSRNPRTIDHRAWERFLESYVSPSPDGINRIAYAAVVPADRAALDDYLATLARVAISDYAPDEQRAFWINLYNALTVQLILAHYPVADIREIDISPGLFAVGPWDHALIEVEGTPLTLNDIEHRILRPIWRDPRIHYALNCAALGCPNLRMEAYIEANMDAALEEAARDYVNHPRGVRFEGDSLVVSSIYVWFEEDFGDGDAGVLDHLRRYALPDLRARLMRAEGIDGDAYDWALNDNPLDEQRGSYRSPNRSSQDPKVTVASPSSSIATRTTSPGSTQRVSTMLPVSTTSPARSGRPVAAA